MSCSEAQKTSEVEHFANTQHSFFEQASNGNRRGWKTSIFDGGIHGDGFLSGPALKKLGIPAGATTEHLFHMVDWLPTVAAIVGSSHTWTDGVNQLPTLRGERVARQTIFLGYSAWYDCPTPEECHSWRRQAAAIRWKKFKLVRWRDMKTYQLFDLSVDPRETLDIAKVKPKLAGALKKMLKNYDSRVNTLPFSTEKCSFPNPPVTTDWGARVQQVECEE